MNKGQNTSKEASILNNEHTDVARLIEQHGGVNELCAYLFHQNRELAELLARSNQMTLEFAKKIDELTKEKKEYMSKMAVLAFDLANMKRMIFGAKKERFKPVTQDVHQLSLFEDEPQAQPEEQPKLERITYEREKSKKKHPGRNPIPEHFPVEERIIEPTQDVRGCQKIGEEITEYVEFTEAVLKKVRIIRPKYAKIASDTDRTSVIIAPLPERPLSKCIASTELVVHTLVRKFVEHMPFYRQAAAFKRNNKWDLSDQTINDWFVAVCTLLQPLYEELTRKVLQQNYLQLDESPINVLQSDKPKSAHQGYMWVYHSPESKLLFFDYQPGRDYSGPSKILAHFTGLLQSDGYSVYKRLATDKRMTIASCLVHVRRKFFDAQDDHRELAHYALGQFKQIYTLESKYKTLSFEQRREQRLEHIFPLLQALKAEIERVSHRIAPSSPIGRAIYYFHDQWPRIKEIFKDGRYELDNNLIENKIRPLALGRKNYLFAGSHEAARRNAMMYSFFACCAAHGLNPTEWLTQAINRIADTKMSELESLLPTAAQAQ
ncbi:MAG: IS66 family transposase [Flavobacteriales bacterium]